MKLPFAIAGVFALVGLAGPAVAGPAEDIVAKAKCNKCHTATTTKKGPSWAAVAEKYKGKPEAVSMLVDLLKTGGKDDHDVIKASDADIKAVVDLVLSAK